MLYSFPRLAPYFFLIFLFTSTTVLGKEKVSLIVKGDHLLTMNANADIIENGAIAINQGKIIAVGKQENILKNYQATKVISGENKILMPGLINGHTHTAMTLFRGIADDLPLMQWLTEYIFPLEGKFVSPEFIRVGAELACYEMIRTGTTTFVDMYFHPEIIAQVTVDCGLRAILASPMIDFPSPGFKGWDDSHAAGVKFVQQWQGKNSRITPALAPHAPYTVAPEHLTEVGNSARELKAPISIHLAETQTEVQQIAERYQSTPVAHSLKLFGDNRVIGAHVVYPQVQDFEAMQSPNFGAIHNPSSNAKLASGVAPISQLIDANIAVGLGTDGAASNNDLNMFEEIRMAALIHKVNEQNPEIIPALQALSLATNNGANAIGMGELVGQITEGYAADVIQVTYDRLSAQPVYDIVSHLAYVLNGSDVVTTIVDGQLLMENAQVKSIDEQALARDVKLISQKINLHFQ